MRVEARTVGSIAHIIQRGTRGMNIVRDEADRLKFARGLYVLNDAYQDPHWFDETRQLPLYERPAYWPDRKPLINLLAWTLLDNHFHLLIEEKEEGGTSKFMQRLCGSMTMSYNSKYLEKGSLFQGGYRSRTVSEDEHYLYLPFYVLVKNTFELYPGGLRAARENFRGAWDWALGYQYSSFGRTFKREATPELFAPHEIIENYFEDKAKCEQNSKDLLEYHHDIRDASYAAVALEPW